MILVFVLFSHFSFYFCSLFLLSFQQKPERYQYLHLLSPLPLVLEMNWIRAYFPHVISILALTWYVIISAGKDLVFPPEKLRQANQKVVVLPLAFQVVSVESLNYTIGFIFEKLQSGSVMYLKELSILHDFLTILSPQWIVVFIQEVAHLFRLRYE